MSAQNRWTQDPDEVLDYTIDWSTWLGADTISTSTWTVSGCTKDSDTNSTTAATIWVSAVTAGTTATCTNTIVTAAGRTKEGYLYLYGRSL